jgi:hypothetical protein
MLFGIATQDAGSVKLGVRDIFTLDLISRSPFVDAERIIRAHKSGYRVEFVPITFLARSSGKARGASVGNILSSLRDCVRLFGQHIIERGVRTSLPTGVQG